MTNKIKLVRPDQAAERLSVSTRTIYRLLDSGQLQGARIRGSVRVVEKSLDLYLERQVALFSLEVGFCDPDDTDGPECSQMAE